MDNAMIAVELMKTLRFDVSDSVTDNSRNNTERMQIYFMSILKWLDEDFPETKNSNYNYLKMHKKGKDWRNKVAESVD